MFISTKIWPRLPIIMGRRGLKVVGFATTYAISVYHSWRGILDTTLCDEVCQ